MTKVFNFVFFPRFEKTDIEKFTKKTLEKLFSVFLNMINVLFSISSFTLTYVAIEYCTLIYSQGKTFPLTAASEGTGSALSMTMPFLSALLSRLRNHFPISPNSKTSDLTVLFRNMFVVFFLFYAISSTSSPPITRRVEKCFSSSSSSR